jgi:hypothetical protein
MELLGAKFVSQLAVVCQAMDGLTGVVWTVDSVVELADVLIPGERRELVEEIGRSDLVDGLLDTERRTGEDFDEETIGCAITQWERLVSELDRRGRPSSIEQWIGAKSADRRSMGMLSGTLTGVSQVSEGSALISIRT